MLWAPFVEQKIRLGRGGVGEGAGGRGYRRIVFALTAALFLLAACQPQVETAPPPTDAAQEAESAAAPTATAAGIVPTRQPLPPTWTPAPSPTPLPAQARETAPASASGSTIFYVYNENVLAFVAEDGSTFGGVPVPQTGTRISGLTAPPDGSLLAYVAPGAGDSRELYVTDRMGAATQLTRVGLARLLAPVWSPDSRTLAYFGSATVDGPLDVYLVNRDGSGQRRLTQLASAAMSNLTWRHDSQWLFFVSNGSVFAANVLLGDVVPLADPGAVGPFFGAAHNPARPELYFIRVEGRVTTDYSGGILYRVDTSEIRPLPERIFDSQVDDVQGLRFSQDGNWMLMLSPTVLRLRDRATNSVVTLVEGAALPMEATFKPDTSRIAYVFNGRGGDDVPQIRVMNRDGTGGTTLTAHAAGTIGDLVWVD